MKKKNLGFLLVLTFLLTSCLFDSSETGMDSWVDSKGIPNTYKVHAVTVSDLMASSAEVFLDSAPMSADIHAILGKTSNVRHDLAMDFAFKTDTTFLKKMKASDSSGIELTLRLMTHLYWSKYYPKDSLKEDEQLDLKLSWRVESSDKGRFKDSLWNVSDSTWYESLSDWEDASSADTTIKIPLAKLAAKKDSCVRITMPRAFVEDLFSLQKYSHIQLKLSLPEASKIYRFYGQDTQFAPFITFFYKDSKEGPIILKNPPYSPYRMADVLTNEEDCKECLVLHGGVRDSLVVELPPEPILKALSDFYGDEFPVSQKEAFDVRQYVILAQLTMARDDSKGSHELGLPIQVVSGSYIDSAGTLVRRRENYRLNDSLIVREGHPNLVFHDGDSLSIQLTYGLRDFINRAQDGRSVKFIMLLGRPYAQEKMTTFQDTVVLDTSANGTIKKDTIPQYLSHMDYARYDVGSVLESPMTLKIWLASKRDKEED